MSHIMKPPKGNRYKKIILSLKHILKTLFVFFLMISTSEKLHSQALKRKAFLGAEIQQIENSIKVTKVVEGTAKQLNLESEDIIVEINKVKISDYASLRNVMDSKMEGDEVNLVVKRNGKNVRLKGKFAGRPLEQSTISEVIYEQVAYKDGQVRTIINKPFKEGKLPAMLFIPGYTCSSIDNLPDNHPYKRIVDAYLEAGFVTMRVEKSGLGDNYNTPECESADLHDEIENFEVALKKLKKLPFVDPEKIIIYGHSMGGIVAPAVSAKNDVAGVVVYGTTAKSWFEYQIELVRVQNKLAGLNPLEHEQSVRNQYDLNYRYFIKKEPLTEIAKDSSSLQALISTFQYEPEHGRIYGRNAEYWRQIQDINHLENWKNTQAKVLVQFGESDFQAFSKADHEQIVETCNYYRPNSAVLQIFPSTDHYFAKSGSMQNAFDKLMNRQILQLFEAYNFDVGNNAADWSHEVINSSNTQKESSLQWKKLNTEPFPGKQDDIYFINEKVGWYVNGHGKVFQTKDGGSSWDKIYEKPGSFFRTIAFLDEQIGFLGTVGTDYFPNVSDTIPLYRTDDGGKSWAPVTYTGPYVKGLCAIDVVKEQFINHGAIDYKTHIYAVGRVGSPANLMYSNDGGKTWTSRSLQQDVKMLFDILMFDKQTGIACAASNEDISKSNAVIIKTNDGGKTWKKVYQSTRLFETTWKAHFPSKEVGYVTIQSYNPDPNVKQQRVAKTTDGGETWKEINLIEDAGARQFGIGFIDEKHGFVGTVNSGFETRDGGQSWTKIDIGRAVNKIRIYQDEQGNKYGYSIGVEVFKLTNH